MDNYFADGDGSSKGATLTYDVIDNIARYANALRPTTRYETTYVASARPSRQAVELFLRDRFAAVCSDVVDKQAIAVTLVVYDHLFHPAPLRGPVCTLRFDGISMTEPQFVHAFEPSEAPALEDSAEAPAPEKAQTADPADAPDTFRAPPKFDDWAPPMPPASESPEPSRLPPFPTNVVQLTETRPPSSLPPTGETDLLARLFEDSFDIEFARTPLEAAKRTLDITLKHLPCDAGLLSFFDIDTREFVVVAQAGGVGSALLSRLSATSALAVATMNSFEPLALTEHSVDEDTGARAARRRALRRAIARSEKWQLAGISLRSVLCAPIALDGRYLGMIELANPARGGDFQTNEVQALRYVADRVAHVLERRGLELDEQTILKAAMLEQRAAV